MTQPTETIIDALMAAGISRTQAEGILAAHDDIKRTNVLTEAELEITLATERNKREYPDEQAMVTRRLGMRAAERVVRGMREEMEHDAGGAADA